MTTTPDKPRNNAEKVSWMFMILFIIILLLKLELPDLKTTVVNIYNQVACKKTLVDHKLLQQLPKTCLHSENSGHYVIMRWAANTGC